MSVKNGDKIIIHKKVYECLERFKGELTSDVDERFGCPSTVTRVED
jgi:hypothetical protein